jgi:tRNA pseudouridine13 synthase
MPTTEGRNPPAVAIIRRTPDDFVVDEIPAYAPSGRGEHLFVTFRKVGLTTPDAVRAIAQALDVDPRGAGYAGMKDRHAVTTQTASFPFPLARDATGAIEKLQLPAITLLGAARHDNKLKPGHLRGNRFTIVLRDLDETLIPSVQDALIDVARAGLPHAFGPQRFGRDGDNPERALAWLAGRERGPRDKRDQRLLFSALQSMLFNRVLDRRVHDGTWATLLPGDLAKKHDTGGLFSVPLEGPDLQKAQMDAAQGAVSPTGPMFGAKMRWPGGYPAELERQVLSEALGGDARLLDAHRQLGSGTRRALRLFVSEFSMASVGAGAMQVSFVLPKGGYATTVLARACQLVDVSASSRAQGGGSDHEERANPAPTQEETEECD